LEKLRKKWGRIVISWEKYDGLFREGWKVDINTGYDGTIDSHGFESLPEAISKAALLAVGER
jgi:hypothetical protein